MNQKPPSDESQSPPANAQSTPCPSCDETMNGWKRAQADYQNLQRETARERQDLIKYGNERLLHELLPAFDQYRLAMSFLPSVETFPEEAKRVWEQWLIGIKAVESLWEQAALHAGLERIPTEGLFNPIMHEAVGEEPSPEAEGTILRVITPGWKLNGKTLQPARVILAKP